MANWKAEKAARLIKPSAGSEGQPDYPAETAASISGTVTAANVMAVPAQGLRAGDLNQILNAMRRGDTYANIHTPLAGFRSGECRGQISLRGGREGEESHED